MLRLTKLVDTDSESVWLSKEINHGDWPFRFAIRLIFTEAYDREWAKTQGKYHFEIHAVSPAAAGEEGCYAAANSIGREDNWQDMADEDIYLMLLDYGISAPLWQKTGKHCGKLESEARAELEKINFLFGFYMDKQVNAIGATGWDFIKGDSTAPLTREEA